MAVLWLQVFLAADSACATQTVETTPAGHHGHHSTSHAPAQHGAQHCLMTVSCTVAVAADMNLVAEVAAPHEHIVPALVAEPASVASALEPPPPRV